MSKKYKLNLQFEMDIERVWNEFLSQKIYDENTKQP